MAVEESMRLHRPVGLRVEVLAGREVHKAAPQYPARARAAMARQSYTPWPLRQVGQ